MNVNGGPPNFMIPGEQAVDLSYRQLPLPQYLTTIRAQLFGTAPDRYMLNYRCQQFLAIAHASTLAPYLTFLDSRISYDFTTPALITRGTQTSTQLAGAADALILQGVPVAPDLSGVMHYQQQIALPSASVARVTGLVPASEYTDTPLTFTNGLSNLVPLPGTGFSFFLTADDVTQVWNVDIVNIPQLTIGQLLQNVQSAAAPALDQLFAGPMEPFVTCRNLWESWNETPLKTAALLVAIIYRMEVLRRQ
jgi:hypothetical protein